MDQQESKGDFLKGEYNHEEEKVSMAENCPLGRSLLT